MSWGPCINHFLLTEWSSPNPACVPLRIPKVGKKASRSITFIQSFISSCFYSFNRYLLPSIICKSLLWKLRSQNKDSLSCWRLQSSEVHSLSWDSPGSTPSLPRPHHCLRQYLLTPNNSISNMYFTLCHKYCTQCLKLACEINKRYFTLSSCRWISMDYKSHIFFLI